jgi:hypothetical protein
VPRRRAGPDDDVAERVFDALRPRVAGQDAGLVALGGGHEFGGPRLATRRQGDADDAPVARVRRPRDQPVPRHAVEQLGHGGLLEQARRGQGGHRPAGAGVEGGQRPPHREAGAAAAQFLGEALDQGVGGARQQVGQEPLGGTMVRRVHWAHAHSPPAGRIDMAPSVSICMRAPQNERM